MRCTFQKSVNKNFFLFLFNLPNFNFMNFFILKSSSEDLVRNFKKTLATCKKVCVQDKRQKFFECI